MTYPNRSYNRGDIVTVDLGDKRRGSVQYGVKPCIIVSDDNLNNKLNTYIVSIVSSQEKGRTYPMIPKIEHTPMPKQSWIHAEQTRSVSENRILKFLGKLDERDMENLEDGVIYQMLKPTYELNFGEYPAPRYRRGEIYLLEQPNQVIKSLPFLVISNDIGNHYSDIVNAVPLIPNTEEARDKYLKGNMIVKKKYSGLNHDSLLLLTQIKTASVEMLTQKIGELTEGYYEVIAERIKENLGINR